MVGDTERVQGPVFVDHGYHQSFQVWLPNILRRKFFALKALHKPAQGREQSERTLDSKENGTPTLKGLSSR